MQMGLQWSLKNADAKGNLLHLYEMPWSVYIGQAENETELQM